MPSSVFNYLVEFYDASGTYLANVNIPIAKSSINSPADIRSNAVATIQAWSLANVGVTPVVYFAGDQTLATVASTGSYNDLSNKPSIPAAKPYESYEALVSQSGTSNPSITALNNDFTGTTLSWTRTGAGVYTITANNPIFTSKTSVYSGQLQNPAANLKYVVTSTTVITITTNIVSLISLLGLSLAGNATDALLISTPIEIRVYP